MDTVIRGQQDKPSFSGFTGGIETPIFGKSIITLRNSQYFVLASSSDDLAHFMIDEKENVLFHHDYDTEITITEQNAEMKPEIKPRKYCISGYKISKNEF